MNDELQKLVALYEAMTMAGAEEAERTRATYAFDEAIRASAASKRVEPRVLRGYVKGVSLEKIRAEERRRGLPPPPTGI
jgi:hypothetical protein